MLAIFIAGSIIYMGILTRIELADASRKARILGNALMVICIWVGLAIVTQA